jgi:hypothetical protein
MPKHAIIKTYGGLEIELNSFLILELEVRSQLSGPAAVFDMLIILDLNQSWGD